VLYYPSGDFCLRVIGKMSLERMAPVQTKARHNKSLKATFAELLHGIKRGLAETVGSQFE
jgi:hypothetical protein